jgi:SAM-dependent methyltransferase
VSASTAAKPLEELTERACPICGSRDDGELFAEPSFDPAALDEHAFASRKRPERMRLRLVRCPDCDLAYASPLPSATALADAYEEAAFDSGEEARYAARTYADSLSDLLPLLPDRVGALDVGTGEGAFLAELLRLGFSAVGGVEPSSAPIAEAAPEIAPLIVHDVFRPGLREPGSLSLVTCFQTIEHVPDPASFVAGAAELLKPGGVLAIVCHNRRAPINRALGTRSPIMDIEHMQLFSPRSITELLRRFGLTSVGYEPIRNRYPIRYWARLAPLPERLSAGVSAGLERSGLGGRPLTVPVGNLLAWGVRA